MSLSLRIISADQVQDTPSPDSEAAFEKAKTGITDGAALSRQQKDENARLQHYITYSTLLEILLAEPDKYSPDQQIALLSSLKKLLTTGDEEEDEAKNDLLRHIGWDLINVLAPYLLVPEPAAENLPSTRQITADIFTVIAEYCNPREVYVMLLQRMGMVDWTRARDNETAAVKAVIELVELGKILMIAVPRISTKNYVKFLVQPIRQFSRALGFLEHLSTQETFAAPRRKQMQYTLLDFALDFAERCAGLLEDHHEPLSFTFDPTSANDEPAQRHYLTSYFVLTIFEHGVLHLELDAARHYYEIYYPRYTVRSPVATSETEKPDANEEEEKATVDLIFRSRITIDRLLLYHDIIRSSPTSVTPSSNDDGEIVSPTSLPLSPRGIAAVVALAAYSQTVLGHRPGAETARKRQKQRRDTDVTRRLIPAVMEPLWVARRTVEAAAGGLMKGQKTTDVNEADKALLLLLYLSDALDEGIFSVEDVQAPLDGDTENLKETTRKGEEGTFTIMKLVQTVATFASISAYAPHRFLAHQLLSQLIVTCADDARMHMLKELIERCPFEPMRAAAVGLLKQQVDSAFKQTQEKAKAPRSVFTSHYLVDTFFPLVLRYERFPSVATESVFWDRHAFLMQSLNFYLYLLMKDKENNWTGVWQKSNLQQVSRELLEPVTANVEHWSQEYEKRERELQEQVGETTEQEDEHEHHHHYHHHHHPYQGAPAGDSLLQTNMPINEEDEDEEATPKATPRQELRSRLLSLSMMQDVIGRVRAVVDQGRGETEEEED
ncbi:hypothetical protein BC937DRAFT_91359 [Endogone sp. FLAS-F59071]|nr:hypothetical protein BC937DRAFT_91359 [Endogone sp. FLAS-F59071]|eukprot:RUS21829.1 hypothetical protein BC937DRAFT_91359 [Endogone sp. FLAS-F59071]